MSTAANHVVCNRGSTTYFHTLAAVSTWNAAATQAESSLLTQAGSFRRSHGSTVAAFGEVPGLCWSDKGRQYKVGMRRPLKPWKLVGPAPSCFRGSAKCLLADATPRKLSRSTIRSHRRSSRFVDTHIRAHIHSWPCRERNDLLPIRLARRSSSSAQNPMQIPRKAQRCQWPTALGKMAPLYKLYVPWLHLSKEQEY